MKRNEAPEKIWMDSEWVPHFTENSIEYIRKDAFIEKAVKYLKDNVTYIHPRNGTKKCVVNIPKFIDYMKGD